MSICKINKAALVMLTARELNIVSTHNATFIPFHFLDTCHILDMLHITCIIMKIKPKQSRFDSAEALIPWDFVFFFFTQRSDYILCTFGHKA